MANGRIQVTVIVPCYNEAEVLPEFYARISGVVTGVGGEWEFLFVNDGSTDDTALLLDQMAVTDPRVKVIHLARNLGHQIALTAGMDFAQGDKIVTIDADLQDPPEVIPVLLRKLDEGYDIVQAQRASRDGETRFKLWTARIFYRLFSKLSGEKLIENCGDFRAFTRPVRVAACHFRERHRFLRGLFASYGFRQAIVPYARQTRAAGTTKYTLAKMIGLAVNGILSFSSAPLRGMLWLAITLWAIGLAFTARAFIATFIFHRTVPGWTSLVVLLTFFTGLNLFSLSVIGAYVGRIFEQGQHRPLYLCANTKNLDIEQVIRDNPDAPEIALLRKMERGQGPRARD